MKTARIMAIALIAALILPLAACGERWPLPEDPQVIIERETEIDGVSVRVLTVSGRDYAYYGRLKGSLRKGDTAGVLGYVARPEFPDDRAQRIIALEGTDDIVAEYYVAGVMEQPVFLRALDTRGQRIDLPGFVEPALDDPDTARLWKEN